MSRTNLFRELDPYAARVLVQELPHEVRLDLVQFGLDILGLANPAADAANAFISLARGDLIGAAISTASIVPVGDVLKVAKLEKYAKTFERLVVDILPREKKLYRVLEPAMEQFRSLLAKVPHTENRAVESIRRSVKKFFDDVRLNRLAAGASTLVRKAQLARSRGRVAAEAYKRTSVADVVERLVNAAEGGGHGSLRINANNLLDRMVQRSWEVKAGPHVTDFARGKMMDRTPHMSVRIDGEAFDYHLRLDAKGHVWEIQTVQRVEGKTQLVNPIPGSPRPWQRPGS